MKKAILILSLSLVCSTASAGSTKAVLNSIASQAEVGNGSANVKTYNLRDFDAQKALEKNLKRVKREFSAKCAPYTTTNYRRESVDAMRKFTGDTKTADALMDLYREDKIAKIYSIKTNNEIDCSSMFVEVYTTDGYVLELYYGMND